MNKKLFLTSIGLSALPKFLDKPLKGLKLIFVPTASNMYQNPTWVENDRQILKGMGFDLTEVDVNGKTKEQLENVCQGAQVIYITGGNTFYLLEKVLKSGFDQVIKKLVDSDAVYIGASAGACLAGPDIEPINLADDPAEAPNLKSTKALGLVDFLVIPHFDEEKYGQQNKQIMEKYGKTFNLLPLDNNQAVLVEGEKYQIVQSD